MSEMGSPRNDSNHRISVAPLDATARVWAGETLVAESTSAFRLFETNHVERLYIPESDVDFSLFESSELQTRCPYKGVATYWNLTALDPPLNNVIWAYREPFDEVGYLRGHVCFYQERVRIEIEDQWSPTEPEAKTVNAFPLWGDASDLIRLMDVQQVEENHFDGPTHTLHPAGKAPSATAGDRALTRNVVEGGQLLGEAIVAASKTIPDQHVLSAKMTFTRAARFDVPTELSVETLRSGKAFSTVEVRVGQQGSLCAPALMLLGSDAPDLIRGPVVMPDVPGPYESEPYDFRVSGRDIRVVDGAYDAKPHRAGPPELYVWIRFRRDPVQTYLRQALLAQATTHWTYAAAMRPYDGVLQGAQTVVDLSNGAKSHIDLSAGVMSVDVTFHDDAPLDEWVLYANRAIWSGRGLAQGEGRIFSERGSLLASYSVVQMIREFVAPPEERQLSYDRIM